MTGKIELTIEGISAEETEKYRQIFATLAASGALKLQSSKVTIHLDNSSSFAGIEVTFWPVKRVEETNERGYRTSKLKEVNELKPTEVS